MANLVAAGQIVQVRIWSQAGDQAGVNTLYTKALSDDGGTLTDQNIADTYDAIMGLRYIPLLANPAEYRGVEVRIQEFPQPGAVFQNASAGNGTGGTITLPRTMSALIRFGTAFGGRQFKGRNYIPFLPVDAVVGDGLMTAAYSALLAAYALALSADIYPVTTGPAGFATIHQVIIHSQTKEGAKHVPPLPIQPPTEVQSWTVSGRFAVQHRRGDFGKPNTPPI